MRFSGRTFLILIFLTGLIFTISCRERQSDAVTVALYTFGAMLQSTGTKQGSFYDSFPDENRSRKEKDPARLAFLRTDRDARRQNGRFQSHASRTRLLSNLVTIPIIPDGHG
jgi:hypothetical protein